jgi:aldehyde:ferredoxin oxidoreductase
MYKLLRVNMTTREVKYQDVPKEYALLGGRALTSRLVKDEVPPECNPLGPANKLIIAPGLLTGTLCPSSGRLSFGAKSPLTGTIKETNSGGVTGQKIAWLGLKAIIVEGQPPSDKPGPYLLHISEDGAHLEPASEYAGMGTYELGDKLREAYGPDIGIIAIGPAGERRMSAAGISNSDSDGQPGRFAARGGLGAVMGSKGLKAIVLKAAREGRVEPQDQDKMREAARKFSKILTEYPVSGQALPAFGTAVLVNIMNEAGVLPVQNYRYSKWELAKNLSGETMAEIIKQRGGKGKTGHRCHPGCVIRCSNIYPDENGEILCAPVEYETIWALGANLTIHNLDYVARLNRLCNDLGLDTMDTGVALGILMEAGVIPFGAADEALKILEEVRAGTALGRIVGNGAALTAKVFGIQRAPVVKGQTLAAYDPRGAKGVGVTYATCPMGADHTAGNAVVENILRIGGYVDPFAIEGQVELSRKLQVACAAVDSLGLCLFTAFALADNPEAMPQVAEMVNAQHGCSWTVDDVVGLGIQALKAELSFNRAAGFVASHDRLPEFFKTEKFPPHNQVFDIPNELVDQTLSVFLGE